MSKFNKKSVKDLFAEEVVSEVLKLMETEGLEWFRPFEKLMQANPVSNTQYRGMNPLILSAVSLKEGFGSPFWSTIKQINSAGGSVKRGSKSTPIYFWSFIDKKDKATGEIIDSFPVFKRFYVFNHEQCRGMSKYEDFEENVMAPLNIELEEFISNTGLNWSHHSEKACYIPSLDAIRMPKPEQFDSMENYYSVFFHELIHWTGSAERLDRSMSTSKHSDEYALEELVAELGAVMLCSKLGVKKQVDPNSAAYLQHWIQGLKNDPMQLWKAASAAQKAVDYLLELQSK